MATEERKRKPKACSTHIVIGAMEENLDMLMNNSDTFTQSRAIRMSELLSELKRSLNGKNQEEEA